MFKKIIKFITGTFLWLILYLTIIATTGAIAAFLYVRPLIKENMFDAKMAINNSKPEDFLTNETSYIFNDDGKILKKLTLNQDSEYLSFADIPRNVLNAFIAVEDRNFWNHKGIDLKGIARVLFEYVETDGEVMHGASTITQQITRRAFLNFDVTMDRKIKEIFYSFELEKKYTKEQILEFYVNNIYYGNNCYGISTAAKFYFNKSIHDLSLSQIAYLCAIPNSPSYYDPLIDATRAVKRRDKILNDMFKCAYISENELNSALKEKIKLDVSGNKVEFSNYQTTYAIKCATEFFMELDGFKFKFEFDDNNDYKTYLAEYNKAYNKAYEKMSSAGCMIYTSLNDEKQEILQTAIDNVMNFDKKLSENNIYELQSAATLIDNNTRKVVAIVGGRTQENAEEIEAELENNVKQEEIYSLNRAFQSYRQPGSSIKPLIVYAPGMESGFNPDSVIQSISVKAVNTKGTEIDKLTGAHWVYRRAVEMSDNGCACYVFYNVGPRKGIKYLQNMEFRKIVPDDYFMSSGLGGFTYGATTEEMAGAYSTLANSGMYARPTCIVSIIDRNGNEIYKDEEEVKVYNESSANAMLDILKTVITHGTPAGTGSIKWDKKIDIGGKTGTTNDQKDGWFCGVSPYYSLSVWVGYDMPRTMNNLWGATYPAKIWSSVMNQIHTDLEEAKFADYNLRDLMIGSEIYYSFLPEQDDSEELSPGYTVADYRADHAIGSIVNNYCWQIANLNVISDNEINSGINMYNNTNKLIDSILNTTYKNELRWTLNSSFATFNEKAEAYRQALLLLMQQQQQNNQNN